MKIYLILTLILTLVLSVAPFSVLLLKDVPDYSVSSFFENKSDSDKIKVMRVGSGNVIKLNMFDYVKGAVASEIPATFESEAIKAQAVACYTYALWIKNNADNASMSDADITDSPKSHQGYFSESELKEKWGKQYEINMQKIEECVSSVFGQYLEYEGKPLMAVYHSLSPGYTENAGTVWGNDIPYLKSVTARGDKLAAEYESSVKFTASKFKELASNLSKMSLSDDEKSWVGNCERDDIGFVKSIRIGSDYYNGNDVRSAFSLKSPFFTLKYSDGTFIFNVKGNGHGLGMSQNSADYMARQGSTYKEILLHFYAGAKIVKV